MNSSKKDKKHNQNTRDDLHDSEEIFDLEYEQDPDHALADSSKQKDKIKTLQSQLKECKTQLKEHIDLLQKMKVDVINIKKDAEEKTTKAKQAAFIEFAKSLSPVLDSLDMAISFFEKDSQAKKGLENVYAQLLQAIQEKGFIVFGQEGEEFDPSLHEAISHKPTKDKQKANKISEVYQKGIKHSSGELVRPAKVEVYIEE